MSLQILSAAVITSTFAALMALQVQVYAQSLSPLVEDQDGDGDLLNEESDVATNCSVDFSSSSSIQGLAESLGVEFEPSVSKEDCDFAMHYLSGQCEEQTAIGTNVTGVCDKSLSDYLVGEDLFTKDFPTDTGRFNAIIDEYYQNKASKEQERAQEEAQEEANKPSWTQDLE